MKAFDENRELRWLFCMTHPDDELAIAGWIYRLTHAGCDVVLTWTHDTPVRRAEALRAAAMLGVSRTFFHGATDGHVVDEITSLRPSFKAMMEQVKPDRIVAGAFEQGHIDHDATNFLVHLTKLRNAVVFEAPFYHTYLTRMPIVNRFSDSTGEEVLQLAQGEIEVKRRLLSNYPSQDILRNMVFADARSRLTGRGSLLSTERLRRQNHVNYLTPNAPPILAAKIVQSEAWIRWLKAVK